MTRNTLASSQMVPSQREKLIRGGVTTYLCEVDNSFDFVSIS